MYYHRNLRAQLQDRLIRLSNAGQDNYQNEAKYLLDFINRTPYLRAVVQELEAQHPDIDWEEWKTNNFSYLQFQLPDTEIAAAKVCYGIVRDCATRQYAASSYANNMSTNSSLRELTNRIVEPFIRYLYNSLDESSSILYLLEKYKRRTEWFHREELLNSINQNTRQSEAIVDANLREYLFDQGIDYPFSTPASTSGRADIVADIGEERPLVMEIKLFEPSRGYDRAYIRQGFRQVFDYAKDYGQSTGYLVVFNCSEQSLIVKTQSTNNTWPPHIELDYQTFFIVVIDLAIPKASASKRGTIKPYVIDAEYLTSGIS